MHVQFAIYGTTAIITLQLFVATHITFFCLARHANTLMKCLIANCEIPISSDWCVAQGVQTPRVDQFKESKVICVAKTNNKKLCTLGARHVSFFFGFSLCFYDVLVECDYPLEFFVVLVEYGCHCLSLQVSYLNLMMWCLKQEVMKNINMQCYKPLVPRMRGCGWKDYKNQVGFLQYAITFNNARR